MDKFHFIRFFSFVCFVVVEVNAATAPVSQNISRGGVARPNLLSAQLLV